MRTVAALAPGNSSCNSQRFKSLKLDQTQPHTHTSKSQELTPHRIHIDQLVSILRPFLPYRTTIDY